MCAKRFIFTVVIVSLLGCFGSSAYAVQLLSDPDEDFNSFGEIQNKCNICAGTEAMNVFIYLETTYPNDYPNHDLTPNLSTPPVLSQSDPTDISKFTTYYMDQIRLYHNTFLAYDATLRWWIKYHGDKTSVTYMPSPSIDWLSDQIGSKEAVLLVIRTPKGLHSIALTGITPYASGAALISFQDPNNPQTMHSGDLYSDGEIFNVFGNFVGNVIDAESISPVPAPLPGTGIPSLIALGGAALWLRRDWLRQALRR
jgi:hypothetical protein